MAFKITKVPKPILTFPPLSLNLLSPFSFSPTRRFPPYLSTHIGPFSTRRPNCHLPLSHSPIAGPHSSAPSPTSRRPLPPPWPHTPPLPGACSSSCLLLSPLMATSMRRAHSHRYLASSSAEMAPPPGHSWPATELHYPTALSAPPLSPLPYKMHP